jgi:hypothetical protein
MRFFDYVELLRERLRHVLHRMLLRRHSLPLLYLHLPELRKSELPVRPGRGRGRGRLKPTAANHHRGVARMSAVSLIPRPGVAQWQIGVVVIAGGFGLGTLLARLAGRGDVIGSLTVVVVSAVAFLVGWSNAASP